MWVIQQGMDCNSTLDECIYRASLIQEPAHLYTSTNIREKIARFVNTVTTSMITAPVRFRHRTSTYRQPTNNEAAEIQSG